jgi:DNA-binding NarL/FixJ family response regulator
MSRVLAELRAAPRAETGERASLADELTACEREVLEMLDHGLKTGQIASQRSISAVTVRRHISEAVRKLEVPDRDAALRVLRDQS